MTLKKSINKKIYRQFLSFSFPWKISFREHSKHKDHFEGIEIDVY